MRRPLFTVVIPCYQSESTVGAAIVSVLAQSVRDLELLVISDGATDGTESAAICAAAGDPRFRLLTQPNRGVSATRNRGVRNARGTFVAFLDADDLWSTDKLAHHLAHLRVEKRVGVSFGRVQYLDPAGEVMDRVSPGAGALEAADMLGGNPTITTSNLVARREVFSAAGGFDESMSFAEDLEWLVRVASTTDWQVSGIDRVTIGYRTSPGGLSSQIARMEEGWETMMDRLWHVAPDVVRMGYRSAKARQLTYLARQSLRTNNGLLSALRYTTRAAFHQPTVVARQLVRAFAPRLVPTSQHPSPHGSQAAA